VTIMVSGGLDELQLLRFTQAAAPIDGYGVGTALSTSADAAALDCAYKLQEYAGRARRKRSQGKATWPGRKQVYRRRDASGQLAGDVITLQGDPHPGEALLRPAMRAGARLPDLPTLAQARAHAAASLRELPEPLRKLEHASYPVEISPALRALAAQVDAERG
jgi:nicotinate phosphoribosyltransferase